MKKMLIVLSLCYTSLLSSQTIAIFQDPTYYELNRNVPGEECLDEVFNITSILTGFGYNNIVAIHDILDFTTDLNGIDILIIPDMEQGDFSNDLPASQAAAIRNFVISGGRLINTGDTQSFNTTTGSVLNDIFGYNLTVSNMGAGTQNFNQTNLPCFADIPSPFNNTSPEGNFVITGGLPANATVLFQGNNSSVSSVVSFSEGNGEVIYLAWDFRQSIPGCRDVNTNWNDLLNCVIQLNNFAPIPTMSQWGIMILFLLMACFSIVSIKQKSFSIAS